MYELMPLLLFLKDHPLVLGIIAWITLGLLWRIFARKKEIGEGEYGPFTIEIKRIVYSRYHQRCARCRHSENLHIHHTIPRADGGDNRISQLILLCPNHHAKAHDVLRAKGYL